jgi:hypothetical protein
MRRTLTACGLAVVVLTGCSSSDKKPAAAPPSSTAPAGNPTTTVRPVDTSFTGVNSGPFCGLAKTYNDRFTNVGAASTPAQLRTVAQDGRTAINQALAAAPAELKPDVQILANAFGALFTDLEKVDFDASKLSVAAFTPIQAPEFQTATIRFQAYVKNVCGVAG